MDTTVFRVIKNLLIFIKLLKMPRKSVEYWKNVFKKSQPYDELRKENGNDSEPDCLKVMLASLER